MCHLGNDILGLEWTRLPHFIALSFMLKEQHIAVFPFGVLLFLGSSLVLLIPSLLCSGTQGLNEATVQDTQQTQ